MLYLVNFSQKILDFCELSHYCRDMSSDRRRLNITTLLAERGVVNISELADSFGISHMTIRRDLEILEMEGYARRIRGGAISAVSRSYEPPILQRQNIESAAKTAIGKAAADLLEDGETAIIDVGTTTLEMAKAINPRLALTIVTSSILIATELSARPQIRTILSGGIVRKGEMSLIGARAEDSMSDINCDSVFLGVAGISEEKGLTEYNLDDTRVKQAAIRSARRVVVLADATKIGRVAFANVAPISQIDVLVTNASPQNKVILALESEGVEIIHVEPIS
jgi:DeoR/GlpR family transcriptional regulator of sugar metabolism